MNLHEIMLLADLFHHAPRGPGTTNVRANNPDGDGIGLLDPSDGWKWESATLLTDGVVRLAQEPSTLLCAGLLGLLLILRPRRRKR
jgi:hypothetical protein